MKKAFLILVALMFGAAAAPSFASCKYDSDRASDGSRCGKRSAESRDGGY